MSFEGGGRCFSRSFELVRSAGAGAEKVKAERDGAGRVDFGSGVALFSAGEDDCQFAVLTT